MFYTIVILTLKFSDTNVCHLLRMRIFAARVALDCRTITRSIAPWTIEEQSARQSALQGVTLRAVRITERTYHLCYIAPYTCSLALRSKPGAREGVAPQLRWCYSYCLYIHVPFFEC